MAPGLDSSPRHEAPSPQHDDNEAESSFPTLSTSDGRYAEADLESDDSLLLSPTDAQDEFLLRRGSNAAPEPDQETKSIWFLVLLTLGIGGLQIAWSVELSNGSPYLLSLGLSKSLMALVWIAGPLTGTLVQPYIGILSDNCRISWGKRKPFMLGGSVATVVGLLFLAWTKEIVSGILGVFGADAESDTVRVCIIITAVIGVYILDVAINTVQAAIRAFIVDCGPAHQQEAANAMASRLTGVGNILGFIAGYVRLTGPLWFMGNTQFQILCAIASLSLGSTVVISCWLIPERDPREGPPATANPSIIAFFKTIFKSIKRLPPQVYRVCQVQFCGWVGYFPLLFYTSSYIGEIYVQPFLEQNPNMSKLEIDELYEQATRIGSFALLINAIVSLLTNVFLPFFVVPTYDVPEDVRVHRTSHAYSRSFTERLRIPGLTLKKAWFGSLILFSMAMMCTLVVRSVEGATAIIGIAGITWAMTLWAPYAIISAEVSRRDASTRADKRRRASSALSQPGIDSTAPGDVVVSTEDQEDQAGVIMGIHNMSIAAPQIVANIGSSVIFKIWQKPRGTPGDNSIGIVLALGGLFVLGSAYFVTKIREDGVSDVERADR